jgi:hypothetical protein
MGNIRLYGSTSGYVEIAPPAVGANNVLTLPTDSIQPGIVLINTTSFSAASTVSVNNCFTSAYENYQIVFNFNGSTTGETLLRMRVSGTDTSGTSYDSQRIEGTSSSTGGAINTSTSSFNIGYAASAATTFNAFTNILAPQLATNTSMISSALRDSGVGGLWPQSAVGRLRNTTQYDGFTLFPTSGTMTGNIRVYGYRN